MRGNITVQLTSYFIFGFSCFAYVELTTDLLVWSIPNKSKQEVSRAVILSPYNVSELFSVEIVHRRDREESKQTFL